MNDQNYSQLRAEVESLRKRMKELAKPEFEAGSKKLFGDFSEIKSFEWGQYTPYNDGEPSSLEVQTSYVDVKGEGSKKVSKEAENAVMSFLNGFEDDDLIDMFGEEIKVTVTREGIAVEGYYE